MGEKNPSSMRSKRAVSAASKKASFPSEEVTASMARAGVEVLWQSGLVEGQQGYDELVVTEIFQAMLRASRQ